jgi:hypothetical protein
MRGLGNGAFISEFYMTTVRNLNENVMRCVRDTTLEECLGLLFSIDELARKSEFTPFYQGRALTLNNIACVQRRMKEYANSIRNLERCTEIIGSRHDPYYSGMTFLNLSAIYFECQEFANHLSLANSSL